MKVLKVDVRHSNLSSWLQKRTHSRENEKADSNVELGLLSTSLAKGVFTVFIAI